MAITVTCPRCEHEQKIDDDKASKGVPCKICHELIKPGAKSKSQEVPKKKEAGIKAGSPDGSGKATGVKKSAKPAYDDEDDDAPKAKSKRRRDDDDDDDDDDDRPSRNRRAKQGGSSAMMFVLIGGGVLLLLIACGGLPLLGFYFFARGDKAGGAEEPLAQIDPRPNDNNPPPIVINPPPQPPPFNPPPFNPPVINPPPFNPPPQVERLDPNDPKAIDRVITILKGPANEHVTAWNWLKDANPDHPKRAEVARLLENDVEAELRNQFAFAGSFFPAFFKWATKDNVPTLMKLAGNDAFNDNGRRKEAMLTLGRLKEAKAADVIASKLNAPFDNDTAFTALKEMGPVAEGSVIKYMNHPDGRARNHARELLKQYQTKSDAVLNQCIADLDSQDAQRRNAAIQWFASNPVDQKRRPDVAKALNKSIPTANFFFEKDLVKVLETWGTADNVPALVQRIEANKTGDRDAVNVLGKIKDVNAMKAVARAMGSVFMKEEAKKALRDYGPGAEVFVIEAMNNGANDPFAKKNYINFLGEIGTKASLPALQQLAFRSQNDRFLLGEISSAQKAIVARGK